MSVQSEQLEERTTVFAVACLQVVDAIPLTPAGRVIAGQLARSATAVAAHYRATCNARSRADFVAKLGLVVEEVDESEFWLDLVRRRAMLPGGVLAPVRCEAVELRAIFGTSLGTARSNLRGRGNPAPAVRASMPAMHHSPNDDQITK